jgi:hypothetical protein
MFCRLMKELMGLCGGFPMSTEFLFPSHCSTLLENVIFSNKCESVFIDSNRDFSVISKHYTFKFSRYIAKSLVNITK